ncbi:Flagellar biosynthesis protein FlhF [Poriferisphaera corsica]|uniref:Flagellar biosynthesis protein FlhF n=2 Tax=Poriferisphaera corsica TaxID=2528020 RepID=A0A517YSH8_9BACT|nr:Flagellar biosynthesis protein FlhF [Poriferisphaera corsica]
MADALQLVKDAYGSDGVILHTRTYKQGGILGFGARNLVEVTAGCGQDIGRQKRRSAQQSPRAVALANAAERRRKLLVQQQKQQQEEQKQLEQVHGTAGDLIKKTYAAARAELQTNQTTTLPATANEVAVAQHAAAAITRSAPSIAPTRLTSNDVQSVVNHPALTKSAPVQPAASTQPQVVYAQPATAYAGNSSGEANEQMADELKAVKRMVSQMMREQNSRIAKTENKPDVPDQLFDQYLALLEQEVSEELVQEIIAQVREELTEEQLSDDKACKEALRKAIAELIPTDCGCDSNVNPFEIDRAKLGGRPKTIALVGPTGVGKTTTIAKLAATFKLKHDKKVALVTLDTYRIAAVDQLRTYAGIIGVDLHVVTSPAELQDTLARTADCDVVLIDTAGRAPRDDQRLQELSQFIQAAQPHEVHLVLSSTCTQNVLMEAVERFSKIRTDRIIFTKLDEAVTFGVVLNVARKVNKQLSYITTGQEVPHQIEPGQSDRLAALVMGEGELVS